MTRVALLKRLDRLEDNAGSLPLYIRRWLGETLTGDELIQADAEWQRMQTEPSVDLSRVTPEARVWLIGRGAAGSCMLLGDDI
jgi:hypothetical protein